MMLFGVLIGTAAALLTKLAWPETPPADLYTIALLGIVISNQAWAQMQKEK